ncbi:MAG: HD domain-containing protein [Candidatus Sericytochromatia bacterium]|nr:HD domain-containing protein [Candidatus Tanganyikabacteria bacterium]
MASERYDELAETLRGLRDRWEAVLGDWRATGRLDLQGCRGIVDGIAICVPGEPTTAAACLRVSGPYAVAHAVNMTGLAIAAGKATGLFGQELRDLGLAALLHDLGKEVPEGHPEAQALLVADDHGLVAERLLADAGVALPVEVVVGIRDHHERTGRQGPGGREPSFLAAIVGFCDVVDSRLTPHFARGATAPDHALKLALMVGDCFPKAVVKGVVDSFSAYPPGASVLLSDHRRGVVVQDRRQDCTRPVVEAEGELVDLAEAGLHVIDLVRVAGEALPVRATA